MPTDPDFERRVIALLKSASTNENRQVYARGVPLKKHSEVDGFRVRGLRRGLLSWETPL